MPNLRRISRTSMALPVMLLLLALVASLACGAVLRPPIGGPAAGQALTQKQIQLPPQRLAQIAAGKQAANLLLIGQNYFLREGKPFARGTGDEAFGLIPLDKMEYSPTQAQLQSAQQLIGPLVKYHDYIHVIGTPVETPDVVDHRSDQTPIKNQNPRGTCVCFASMAGLEMAYGGGSLDFSEQYANYLFMKAESSVCKDDGLQTHMSADYLTAHGVCTETTCPYQTSFAAWCNNGASPPTTQRASADGNCPFKIKSYTKIWRKDDLTTDTGLWINNPRYLEAILRSGKDIIFGTHVAGWVSPYTGILDVKLDPSGNPLPSVGGHAMLIVGYNRPEHYFIVKNSWGADKGQAGYVYLSYDYLRTYAKYGYIINDVEPLLLTVIPRVFQVMPRMITPPVR